MAAEPTDPSHGYGVNDGAPPLTVDAGDGGSGVIVGTPFALKDGRTLVIPTGAADLPIGVSDKAGSWNISVAGDATSAVPAPATWLLLLSGLGLVAGFDPRHSFT